jgi:hypothetical protein
MQCIRSVGVLSSAKMLGVLYGCMGLLFIPIALVAGLASMATQQAKSAIGGAAHAGLGDPRSGSLWCDGVRVRCHRGMDLQLDREVVGRD